MTDHADAIAAARATILAEAEGLKALAAALDGPMGLAFGQACEALLAVSGRTIVTGMGKSGHIARKIAATFASTGQPASFVHPAEASHGDLGMITPADCVLALSRSGETAELNDLIHHCRRLAIPLIGMTFRAQSALARMSTAALVMPDCGEADDDTPAPTTSTTMTLALGDALAVALLKERGFDAAAFSQYHPGGKLGALLKRVRDVMRDAAHAPLIGPATPVPDTLAAMTEGGIGCVGVIDDVGRLIGIVTDGDLRRRLTPEAFTKTAADLMTANPKALKSDAPLADAIALMNSARVTTLFVVEANRPVGVVHMHDLLAAGVR
jgi:arabinose-5-phosphate isomerase